MMYFLSKNERRKIEHMCYEKMKRNIFNIFLFVDNFSVTFLRNIRIYKYFALTNTRVRVRMVPISTIKKPRQSIFKKIYMKYS